MEYAEKLDAEIAEAMAQVDEIRKLAEAGDKMAALLIRRLDEARAATLRDAASKFFG